MYGWFSDSFTGIEQGPGFSIPVGYQKGAAQAAQNFVFGVADQPVTASMYSTKSCCEIYMLIMIRGWK